MSAGKYSAAIPLARDNSEDRRSLIGPRRLIMGHNLPRTAEMMNSKFGAEVIPVDLPPERSLILM
jgi:hypothetical protein